MVRHRSTSLFYGLSNSSAHKYLPSILFLVSIETTKGRCHVTASLPQCTHMIHALYTWTSEMTVEMANGTDLGHCVLVFELKEKFGKVNTRGKLHHC